MSKHTPGPWTFVVEAGGNFAILDAQGRALQSDEKYYPWVSKNIADWHLIAAAPDLLAAQTMGAQLNTPDFLDWVADRLVHVHGDNPNADFVHTLRDRAKAGRAAIAKATGEPS